MCEPDFMVIHPIFTETFHPKTHNVNIMVELEEKSGDSQNEKIHNYDTMDICTKFHGKQKWRTN